MTNGFEKIKQQEARLAEMRAQITTLSAEDQKLGGQVAQVLAEGADATKLRVHRAEVRQLRADLTEAAALLEQRLTADREAAGREAAQARQVGIRRAFGSLLDQYERRIDRLRAAAEQYARAGAEVNETFKALGTLRDEDAALVDRFGLARSALAPVIAPCRHDRVTGAWRQAAGFVGQDTWSLSPSTEANEFGARRRDYAELKGTAAYEIITQSGLKPFPPPTAEQREGRERQKAEEAETTARFAAEGVRALRRSVL